MSEQHQVPPCQNSNQNTDINKRTLCVNNCGFFGHPSTQDYCSKCFKDVNSSQTTPSSSSSNAQPPTTSPQQPSPAPTASPPPTKQLEQLSVSPKPTLELKSTEAKTVEAASTPTVSTKPKKKKKNRCGFGDCRRKVGLMGGFECRCDLTFCGEHRLPYSHKCSVDVKKIQQAKVQKDNPVIEHSKFEKI